MADNKKRGRFGKGSEEAGQSIFDLFEPPPEQEVSSFGRIPIIRDDEYEEDESLDLTDVEFVEAKAAAEAEAAGLQHWTEPATGQIPASLAADGDGQANELRGPSWMGDDQNWAGPDLADVFADTEAITHERAEPRQFDDPIIEPSAPAAGTAPARRIPEASSLFDLDDRPPPVGAHDRLDPQPPAPSRGERPPPVARGPEQQPPPRRVVDLSEPMSPAQRAERQRSESGRPSMADHVPAPNPSLSGRLGSTALPDFDLDAPAPSRGAHDAVPRRAPAPQAPPQPENRGPGSQQPMHADDRGPGSQMPGPSETGDLRPPSSMHADDRGPGSQMPGPSETGDLRPPSPMHADDRGPGSQTPPAPENRDLRPQMPPQPENRGPGSQQPMHAEGLRLGSQLPGPSETGDLRPDAPRLAETGELRDQGQRQPENRAPAPQMSRQPENRAPAPQVARPPENRDLRPQGPRLAETGELRPQVPPPDRGAFAPEAAPRGHGEARRPDADRGPVLGGDELPPIDDLEYDDFYDDESEGSGRSLGQSLIVGIAMAAVVFIALGLGPVVSMALIGVLTLLAVMELFNAMRIAGLRPATLLGLVGAVAVPAATYVRGEAGYPLVVGLAVVFGMLWYLTGADTERPVLNLGLTLTGILWVGGLAGFAALILREDGGVGLLLAVILITATSDTMAYLGGRAYGTKPFHEASPNKTWEGTLTGFFGALFAGLAIGVTDFIPIFEGHFQATMVLAVVIGVLAPIGDLAESLIKRDLGIKDMGSLLPGHGGVLDRVDALLFALPGAYYVAVVYTLF